MSAFKGGTKHHPKQERNEWWFGPHVFSDVEGGHSLQALLTYVFFSKRGDVAGPFKNHELGVNQKWLSPFR